MSPLMPMDGTESVFAPSFSSQSSLVLRAPSPDVSASGAPHGHATRPSSPPVPRRAGHDDDHTGKLPAYSASPHSPLVSRSPSTAISYAWSWRRRATRINSKCCNRIISITKTGREDVTTHASSSRHRWCNGIFRDTYWLTYPTTAYYASRSSSSEQRLDTACCICTNSPLPLSVLCISRCKWRSFRCTFGRSSVKLNKGFLETSNLSAESTTRSNSSLPFSGSGCKGTIM